MPRKYPNILITGTPGVGKTTTALDLISSAAEADPPIPLKHLSINDIARTKNLYESYDEDLDTHVVDEDKLLDHVETLLSNGQGEGGFVLDWHVCDLFPERWIDLVVVLRCEDTKVFYQRLQERKYNDKKREENIDAEIFGVVSDEAKDAYGNTEEKVEVVELKSVQVDDVQENVERIVKWVEIWIDINGNEDDGGEDGDEKEGEEDNDD